MSIRTVLEFPDRRLRTKAKEVTVFDQAIKTLVDDMLETMYEAKGVGLAATQINVHQRVIVIDVSEEKDAPLCLINPEIIEKEGDDWEFKESCLSVPGIAEYVSRPQTIRVQYFDENFNFCDEKYSGMVARIIQHEYDHIMGILFVEKIHNLRKTLIKRKLLDISKGNVTASYKMIFGNKKKKK